MSEEVLPELPAFKTGEGFHDERAKTRREPTFRQKARYKFDDYMSRGSTSGFVALTIVFMSLLVIISVLRVIAVAILGDPNGVERGTGVWRQVYLTFLELTDPGSMTQDVTSSPVVKIFAVIAGMAGLVCFSALIAFVTNLLDQRMQSLRKGHSQVILDDHTLILGWNERVIDILDELILAFESEDNPGIVILADRDKEEMDDYLALNLSDSKNTKIVTRSGRESALVNLKIAAIETAKAVIVLATAEPTAPPEDLEQSDVQVIKTVLAACSLLPPDQAVPLVAEIHSPDRRDLATSIDPEHVVCIDASEMLAKILVQTSRSEGLAVVYEEMLSFDGSEIYFHEEAQMVGRRFGELAYLMPDGVPLGLQTHAGQITLNPEPQVVVNQGDRLIVLAQDDSTIGFESHSIQAPTIYPPSSQRVLSRQERELLIGWTPKVKTIVEEYSDYVQQGSAIDILLRSPSVEARQEANELQRTVGNIDVSVLQADPFDREDLLSLRPFEYDNIIILSEAGQEGSAEWVDSETVLLLLQLQQLFKQQPDKPTTKLIAEVLDSRNRELITQTGTNEFIISNRLISMIAAQLSENADMRFVYDQLFSEDGSEVYLKPLYLYFAQMPRHGTFADLLVAAQQRQEVALGIRDHRLADEADQNFGVRLVPPKTEMFAFDPRDSLVVMAEDET